MRGSVSIILRLEPRFKTGAPFLSMIETISDGPETKPGRLIPDAAGARRIKMAGYLTSICQIRPSGIREENCFPPVVQEIGHWMERRSSRKRRCSGSAQVLESDARACLD
jgi:hypothetical protein